ncbi:MAG: galactose-1-phosphate uridylyltransferase [Candidatus Latescibacteria bacterium]|jgi:UDPglucose--hexose-1-phosphate uridylyltransferase|nr:galactose-1-phosphate uridylyltransferase [Candidatus Latescibacterota bacterium]
MPKRSSFKRWDPLNGEWVIIAPATAVRPWSGILVSNTKNELPEFDPGCYLCPGVKRASGEINPDYTDIYVFENDFPSFSMSYTVDDEKKTHPLDESANGICRVVCFSKKHNITLAEMTHEGILKVICAFRDQFNELSSIPDINNVMIFENKGKVIGVSNPHPHGQIYATDFVPRTLLTRYSQARKFMDKKGICLFCSIIEEEIANGSRIVCQNEHFVAFVPYFAHYAYEILLMPKRHVPTINELDEYELDSLACIYREILIRYDNLFRMSFPNITIFNNAPCTEEFTPEPFHFHIDFCPPLRNRDKLKYMAGFETGGGNIINPSLPDESAESLRTVPAIHYTKEAS